ncbi:MAG TPA: hypothetical protein PKC59_00640 [Burkholderiaceae bacterium]|nr:hypothetical protein [Burkholderiaceae bacterium]HMX10000.1 hypothetical protein [Burkholderiaceae bacterium]HMZ00148.1 hypothetical protein [Burkholderiaceae bacterium]HNB43794.1 hypothetical protein [Burkholderiaceae bacterium]HNG79468.1 hypothetical protein [Burkholderiaceae bacterium]
MLDRIVIEKVGAGLGLAFALALLVKMLLPHARRVQVDLWLHTQRLRLRPGLRTPRAVRVAEPAVEVLPAAPASVPAAIPLAVPAHGQPAPRPAYPHRPIPRSSTRGRRQEGEWNGNVFHLRPNPARRALH